MSLDRCRVVLIRPQVAANIGATARVMRNMGLAELVIVAPAVDHTSRDARQLSTHGESILDRARIVSHLGEAVADCGVVAATSARTGKLMRGQFDSPEVICRRLAEAIWRSPVALVFGPEPTGLTNEEVDRCHFLIHIPADETYPALNLAQAVAICSYELRNQWLMQVEPSDARQIASHETQEEMFAHLQHALEEIHFLYGEKAQTLMHGIRHLIGRAGPTETEVKILHGLARQLEWYVREHSRDGR